MEGHPNSQDINNAALVQWGSKPHHFPPLQLAMGLHLLSSTTNLGVDSDTYKGGALEVGLPPREFPFPLSQVQRSTVGDGKMAHWIKALATKPHNLGSNPRTHIVGGGN